MKKFGILVPVVTLRQPGARITQGLISVCNEMTGLAARVSSL